MTVPSNTCGSNEIVSWVSFSGTYFKDEEYWLFLYNFKVNVLQQLHRKKEVKCFGLFLNELPLAKSPLHIIFYHFPDFDVPNSTVMDHKPWSKALIICSSELDTNSKSPAEFHKSQRIKSCFQSMLLRSRQTDTFQPDSSHYCITPTIWIRTSVKSITKPSISELQSFQTF